MPCGTHCDLLGYALALPTTMHALSLSPLRHSAAAVCDSFGPRYGHGVVQLLTASATFGMAAVMDTAGFIACRMLIGEPHPWWPPALLLLLLLSPCTPCNAS